jgi:hypothetical protein
MGSDLAKDRHGIAQQYVSRSCRDSSYASIFA